MSKLGRHSSICRDWGQDFFYLEDKNVLYNVCWFLLYNKVNQLLYIHPHPLEPPSNPAPIPSL